MTETQTVTLYYAVGWCYDHKEVIGPDRSEDVGWEMAMGEHEDCETENIDEWKEDVEVPVEELQKERWDASGTLGGVG